jgi:hypothetical protein
MPLRPRKGKGTGMYAVGRLSLCEGEEEGEGMELLLESNPSPLSSPLLEGER